MSEKTRAELKLERDNLIADGAPGSIQPEDDNALRKNEADSAVNILDDRNLLNLRNYDNSRSKPYQVSECYLRDGQIRTAIVEHSGAYNAAYSIPITKPLITSIVPAYSAGVEIDPGEVVSYEGSLFLKIGSAATGADPYDSFEFTQFAPLLPYYGVPYQTNQVYVTNMVVRIQEGGKWKLYRKVKPTGGSPEFIYSSDFAAEKTAGEWELEIDEQEIPAETIDAAVILGSAYEVSGSSDHGKSFIKTGDPCEVTLGVAPSGVKVYFYVYDTGSINFTGSGGSISSQSSTHSINYIECCAISLGSGSWIITQTDTP